ncbi:cache domain-containing protein [Solemya pervernicosa gill symbiont]|uniref:cache domain-containing protein n=1 Tax=Solemya pervernicosa gill symbiont TaxID=642797 RepID=UPI0015617B10|nr:cache domain-containing protein [Solemya pervernicosa gill symbiont]
MDKQADNLMEQVGSSIVLELESRIAHTEALTKAIAGAGEILPQDESAHKHSLLHLVDQPGTASYVAGGGVWPEPYLFDDHVERRSFFWGRNAEGKLDYYEDYNDPEGPGYHHEEWYVPAKMLQRGEVYWSRSYFDPYSGQAMVTCTAPMFREGRFYGVSTIDLKLKGLNELLEEKSSVLGGYVFVLDRFGAFISFPEESMFKKSVTNAAGEEHEELLNYSDLAANNAHFQPIAKTIDLLQADLVNNAIQTGNFSEELVEYLSKESYQISTSDARILAATLSDTRHAEDSSPLLLKTFSIENDLLLGEASQVGVFHVPGTYWKIVTVAPESRGFNALSSMRLPLFTAVAAITIVLAIGFVFLLRLFSIRLSA